MRTSRLLRPLGIVAGVVAAFAVAAPGALAQDPEPPVEEQTEQQPQQQTQTAAQKRAQNLRKKRALKKIRQYRKQTWRWQRLMRVPLSQSRRVSRTASLSYHRSVMRRWKQKAATSRRKAMNPPRLRAWRCIQRYEGAWNANTGNGYYGGLQMDLSFQRMYGRDLLRKKGTANRWKPIEQMWVAERAYRSGRGFHPWPNTARKCGLI